MFASHPGYSTSLMNPTSNNFSISSWITFCLSRWNRRTFCRTGLDEVKVLRWCEATIRCISVMSEWAQVKTSRFCWNTLWSSCSSSDCKRELMCVKCPSISEIWTTFNGSASGGSLSAGCCNCYWSGGFVFLGDCSRSVLGPTSRAIW